MLIPLNPRLFLETLAVKDHIFKKKKPNNTALQTYLTDQIISC